MSTAKKLDEASVSAMIGGFLAGTKKKIISDRKNKVRLKENAFWKDVVSLIKEASDRYDDYRQDSDMYSPDERAGDMANFGNIAKDESQLGKEKPEEAPEAAETVKQTHGKKVISRKELNAKINAKLKDPKSVKVLKAMSPEQQANFKKILARKILDSENARVGDEAGAAGKITARTSNPELVKQKISPLVVRVVKAMADIVKQGGEIPTEMSAFSQHYLDLNPNAGGFAKYLKMTDITPESIGPVLDKAMKKGDIVRFMRHNIDAFPHHISSDAEEFANKNNISDFGGKVKRVEYDPREYKELYRSVLDSVKGDEAKAKEILAKQGISDPLEMKAKKRNAAHLIKRSQEATEPESIEALGKKAEEAKIAAKSQAPITGRAEGGTEKIGKMFEKFPLDMIFKMGSYMKGRPEEVARAQRERRASPPQGLPDIMGRLPGHDEGGEETKQSRLAALGGENASSIVDPDAVATAKADWRKRLDVATKAAKDPSRFGKEEDPYADRAPAFDSSSAKVDYKKMFQSMFDIDQGAEAGVGGVLDNWASKNDVDAKPSDSRPTFDRLINQVVSSYKDPENPNYRASPETVLKMLRLLAARDSSGEFTGLKPITKIDPGHPLTDDEIKLGMYLTQTLDPKRTNKETGDLMTGEEPALKQYAHAELEKKAANIPVHSRLKSAHKQHRELELKRKEEEAAAEKAKAGSMSPEEMDQHHKSSFDSRMGMFQAMTDRAEEFEDHKEKTRQTLAKQKAQMAAGEAPKFSKSDVENLTQVTKPTPARTAGISHPDFGPGTGGAPLFGVPNTTGKGGVPQLHRGDYKPDFADKYKRPQRPEGGLPPRLPTTSGDPHTTPFDKDSATQKSTRADLHTAGDPNKKAEVDFSKSSGKKAHRLQQMPRRFDRPGDIAYDTQSSAEMKPKMIKALEDDARKAIAMAGLPLDKKTVRDLIKARFEKNYYSSKYDSLKDFYLDDSNEKSTDSYPQDASKFGAAGIDDKEKPKSNTGNGVQGGTNLSKRGERDVKNPDIKFTKTDSQPEPKKVPSGTKKKSGAAPFQGPKKSKEEESRERLNAKKKEKEGKTSPFTKDEKDDSKEEVKTEHFSLYETLFSGDKEKETETKVSNWDKAKPTKQQKFEPKLTLKELFTEEDK